MRDPFARLNQSVLSRLGRDAFLRGSTTPFKCDIERGVEVNEVRGYQHNLDEVYGQLTAKRTIATIPASLNPKAGDTLAFVNESGVTENHKLDYLVDEDGYAKRFVLVEA